MTAFLEGVLCGLGEWCQALGPFPMVSWPAFISYLRETVNPLAGEEHLKEVVQQLQLMGEVVYVKSDQEDIIVLDPKWLCSTVCGTLLSPQFRQTT